MILLIDNYDSFTFNLQRYLLQLGQQVAVVRNTSPELDNDLAAKYSAVLISPGPKAPKDAGKCKQVVATWSGRLPIFGVCLGHQVICETFGGTIRRASRPTHGKSSRLIRELAGTCEPATESSLLQGVPPDAAFARYHSLVVDGDSLPPCLRPTCWSEEDLEVMSVEHESHLTFGVQFHPESILSAAGYQVLANFLNRASLASDLKLPAQDLVHSERPAELVGEAEGDPLPVVLPVNSGRNTAI